MTNEKNTKKLKVVQVGANSQYASEKGDYLACSILESEGFVSRDTFGGKKGNPFTYLGAVPDKGKEFFVYYNEPQTEKEKGAFRLVRVNAGIEILVDEGTASKSHIHGGLNTLTFYASGKELGWSFHCEIPENSEEEND
ncbi:hypothetical protein J4402_05610 [Candidatus Pacearchaeota archaeon]|nr:hypothetical protein [Candidatus Pacearchaeota archaeon]